MESYDTLVSCRPFLDPNSADRARIMDQPKTATADGDVATEAFALEALRTAVRREGQTAYGHQPALPVHAILSTPLQAVVPDVWTAYAWGAAARLLGTISERSVAYVADVAHAQGDPRAAAELLVEGLDQPPVDGPSGGDPDYLLTDFVVGGFLATLGRMPTTDDLERYVKLLRGGLDPAVALEGLIRSAESHRAFRHPRPWPLYQPDGDAANDYQAPSLRSRARHLLAPTPSRDQFGELAARLDAIAESQWRLSKQIIDRVD